MTHEKKIWPEFFEKILSGDKTFELRLADWDCQAGDTLILREWDPANSTYTGKKLEKIVGDVIKTKNLDFWTNDEIEKFGYQIISLK